MSNGPILLKSIFGSKLYGLDGPDSDTDYKSIHLPFSTDLLLMQACRVSHSESGGEVDSPNKEEYESFALQEFLKHCVQGQSYAIDLLHTSPEHWELSSDVWIKLRNNREKFYTKTMTGALDYAKNMALKYGFRADRLAALESVRDCLAVAQKDGVSRMYQIWDKLPAGQHIYVGTDERNNNTDKRFYEVAGKKLQATITIDYALEVMNNSIERYGARVNEAKQMGGADMKAMSHSFRVGYELRHIYLYGGFCFPLPESQFLRDVKFGALRIVEDGLDQKLNDLITEVEHLSELSLYPQSANSTFVRKFILETYEQLGV